MLEVAVLREELAIAVILTVTVMIAGLDHRLPRGRPAILACGRVVQLFPVSAWYQVEPAGSASTVAYRPSCWWVDGPRWSWVKMVPRPRSTLCTLIKGSANQRCMAVRAPSQSARPKRPKYGCCLAFGQVSVPSRGSPSVQPLKLRMACIRSTTLPGERMPSS